VKSVLAPYFCTQCAAAHVQLLDLSRPVSLDTKVPCPSCGNPMQFDDLPDIYLSFREVA
jgi:hypothetical protein